MGLQLLVGGLDEHRLEDGDTLRSHAYAHLGKADALAGADRPDAHVYRHSAGNLVHQDGQRLSHLILFHHVELTVGTEGEDAAAPALNHKVDQGTQCRFVHLFILSDRGENRGYDAFDKTRVHELSYSPIVVPLTFA